MQGSNATIPSFLCMHIEMDSSVAKELRKERVSILFIYKITTLSMGERMQSLKSSCLLFSFFKWTEKDDGEWLKVYAISISFTCPWNEMENMVSTPVALVLLIFQAEDSPQCSSPRAKMKNVPQKLLFDLKRLSSVEHPILQPGKSGQTPQGKCRPWILKRIKLASPSFP